MLRITKSFLTIAVVAAIAVGATGAYFDDQEVVTGNGFTAGTLDLKVDGVDNPTTSSVNFADFKPGDTKKHYWVLKNIGSIPGNISITFSAITNLENSLEEPELAMSDTGPAGELGANVQVWLRWSQDGGVTWKEIRLVDEPFSTKLDKVGGSIVGRGLLGSVKPDGTVVLDNAIPTLNQDDEVKIQLQGTMQTGVTSIIQSDSALFDMTFSLDQVIL